MCNERGGARGVQTGYWVQAMVVQYSEQPHRVLPDPDELCSDIRWIRKHDALPSPCFGSISPRDSWGYLRLKR